MTSTPVGMRCPECAKQRTRVVRGVRSAARIPRVTYGLIALNVIVFLTEQGQFTVFGSEVHGKVFEELVLDRGLISVEHQYWRLITTGFLHVNLLHIFFNMYLLYLLGMLLEPAMGSLRFAAVYFISLLAGSFGALLATPAPTLGASGAVFGLMGAAVVELRARRMSVLESGIGGLIVINLVLSFTLSGISVGAHIGGLIGGALTALAIRAADERKLPAAGAVACVLLAAVAVAGSLIAAEATGAGFA
jgi:membrane associated rhomboid family serine protease